jgi:hypothetical protein
MERQIAYMGAAEAGPDEEALRDARDFYERGLKADMNSHYCGVNARRTAVTRAAAVLGHARSPTAGVMHNSNDSHRRLVTAKLEGVASSREMEAGCDSVTEDLVGPPVGH